MRVTEVSRTARCAGFSVVELFLVVAVVGILSTITIPELMQSRARTNETAAIGALRTIAGAQTDYNNNSVPHTYAESLEVLGTGEGAGGVPYIDAQLASGRLHGYRFAIGLADSNTWSATAEPAVSGATGRRSFTIDADGIITAIDPCPPDPVESASSLGWADSASHRIVRSVGRMVSAAITLLSTDDPGRRPPGLVQRREAAEYLAAALDIDGDGIPTLRDIIIKDPPRPSPGDVSAEHDAIEGLVAAMDGDEDGFLTLREVVETDPLCVVRSFLGTGGGGEGDPPACPGPEIGPDAALRKLTGEFSAWLEGHLRLGVANEDETASPGLSVEDLPPDSVGRLEAWMRDLSRPE